MEYEYDILRRLLWCGFELNFDAIERSDDLSSARWKEVRPIRGRTSQNLSSAPAWSPWKQRPCREFRPDTSPRSLCLLAVVLKHHFVTPLQLHSWMHPYSNQECLWGLRRAGSLPILSQLGVEVAHTLSSNLYRRRKFARHQVCTGAGCHWKQVLLKIHSHSCPSWDVYEGDSQDLRCFQFRCLLDRRWMYSELLLSW